MRLNKKTKKFHPSKFIILRNVLLAVIVSMIIGTLVYANSAKNNVEDLLSKSTGPQSVIVINKNNKAVAPPPSSSSQSQAKPSSASVPFFISKVYFAQAPKITLGPPSGQCKVGDMIQYLVKAQVTVSKGGTMKAHWETADHMAGTVEKYNSVPSDLKSGTQDVGIYLTYKVRDTGNGSNLYNRIYVNLVTDSPNVTYANVDKQVYAYKNSTEPFFVWGSYIDFC